MKLSIEHRKKISETMKQKGFRPPSQKGKKQSIEHIEKVRQSNLGKKRSLLARKHMSESHIGKPSHWSGKKRPGLHSDEWKLIHKKRMTGENNPNWKGGKKMVNGYVYLYTPKHPFAVHSYVSEHRLVIEEFLGRYLNSNEIVHHRNAIKDDNRLDNLQVMLRTAHMGEVDCPKCGYKFLIK